MWDVYQDYSQEINIISFLYSQLSTEHQDSAVKYMGLGVYLDDCVCVLPDLTWLPLLGVGRKSWYIICIVEDPILILVKCSTVF